MFWLDISPSFREAKSCACHCQSVEDRRGNLNYSKERYIWAQIHILQETDKAALVDNGMRIWIPKSRIHGISLRNNIFEIYVRESTVG